MKELIIKRINKGLGVLVAGILLATAAKAQGNIRARAAADSLAAVKISAETDLSRAKAVKARQAITYRKTDFADIAASRNLDEVQKVSQLIAILNQRRRKLDSVLTTEEYTKLLKQQEPQRRKQRAADSLILLQQQERMRQAGGQLIDRN